jgi:hypothetical protein
VSFHRSRSESTPDAIKPYFGDAAGAQLTSLLHDHITIAVEILQAAKAGDTDASNDAIAR